MDEITIRRDDLYGRPAITVRVGDKVSVRAWGGDLVRGTVTAVHANVKNDTPGIDYTTESGATHWAYEGQIERVSR